MKKWAVGIIILVLLFLAGVYFIIPRQINISILVSLNTPYKSVYRCLSQDDMISQWWPKVSKAKPFFPQPTRSRYVYDETGFTITELLINTLHINIDHRQRSFDSKLYLIPLPQDSTSIRWQTQVNAGNGLTGRLSNYFAAAAIKKNMLDILHHFTRFCANERNLYGIDISQSSTRDTLLIATKFFAPASPTLSDIYDHINLLKAYCNSEGITATGFPMLNVTRKDNGKFQGMVALPVNKPSEGRGNIFQVRMVPGNFIVTEVKGGNSTIRQGYEKLRLYFEEYRRSAVAIPFEYLVTDRLREPDTAQWKTIIYAPVY